MRNTDYTTDKRLWVRNSIQIFFVVIVCLFLVIFGSMTLANDRQEQSNTKNAELASEIESDNNELNKSESLSGENNGNTPEGNLQNNSVSISEDSVELELDSTKKAETDASSSSISIEISSEPQTSNSTSEEKSDKNTSLTVNGETIEIPENGRHRETIKNENTTTKLRTNIDGNGSSSINISTESN